MSYVVDPHVFDAKGGVIDWGAVARSRQKAVPAEAIAKERGLSATWSIQLRWGFDPALGYPIEPFIVWMKPRGEAEREIGFMKTPFGYLLQEPRDEIELHITATGPGLVQAYAGMPLLAAPVGRVSVAGGTTVVRVTGSAIRSLMISGAITVHSITTTLDPADDPNWQPIEYVGLPTVDVTSSHSDLQAPQGMVNAGLVSPPDAALDRFSRGAPFYGWADHISAGVPVTPWELANPKTMIEVFNVEMVPDFVDMLDNAFGSGQVGREYQRPLAVPTGSQSADAQFNPLSAVLYGGLSDPLAALVLGLGTAYPWTPMRATRNLTALVPATVPDFMITGIFLDDLGNKVERACFVLGPGPLLPPPTPGGLTATSPGVQSPQNLDGPYRAVVNATWNHLPPVFDFAIGSHAFARRALNPMRPVEMLLNPRAKDTALQPVGASRNEDVPNIRSLADTSWPIDATVTPNALRYAVANQNVFGLWSGWAETGVGVSGPPLNRIALTAARLDCPPAGAPVPLGVVPASVQFDVSWDWTSRSPRSITIVGRRYSQNKASDQPSNLTPPTANTFTSSGSGVLATLEFNTVGTITAVTPGAGLTASAEHLTLDGQHSSAVPLQDRSTRRYRVTVTGLSLDFDTAPRWGLGLWARGQEAAAPQRVSGWNTVTVLSAADPRPPVSTTIFDNVTLASLRDGDGIHHARFSWIAMSGAVAYQVYMASESGLRTHYGLPEPQASDTLTQRLTVLQNAFGADPDRRCWTRMSKDPVTGTSVPVQLPRGSKEIHCYMVLGVSAGNVESEWPTSADPQCGKRFVGFAAPVVVTPPAPSLEVSQGIDRVSDPTSYFAQVRVGCDQGARIGRVDLYRTRVADAAAQVDTMGPPHVSISASDANYTVHSDSEHPILRVTGADTVNQGSWKPVFYRAVAWTMDDPTRGQYAGRSAPSVPRSVVVPPAGPPPLGSPMAVSPILGSPLIRVDFATSAPIADTVLGPHVLSATAHLVAADGAVVPVELETGSASLSALPTSQPGAGKSGLWRDETTAGSTPLHLLVRRTDPAHRIRVRLRLADPLGRITEKSIDVPELPAAVPPDITSPQLDAVTDGWVLTFTTTVPDSTGMGAYVLKVTLKRPRIARAESVMVNLADLPLPPRPPRTIFTSTTDPIPVAASKRTRGQRSIGIGFRNPGKALIELVAPDGTKTTITRTIGES